MHLHTKILFLCSELLTYPYHFDPGEMHTLSFHSISVRGYLRIRIILIRVKCIRFDLHSILIVVQANDNLHYSRFLFYNRSRSCGSAIYRMNHMQLPRLRTFLFHT